MWQPGYRVLTRNHTQGYNGGVGLQHLGRLRASAEAAPFQVRVRFRVRVKVRVRVRVRVRVMVRVRVRVRVMVRTRVRADLLGEAELREEARVVVVELHLG